MAIDGVQNLLGIKARQVGSTIYADVTITVIPSMSVRTSHEIADLIEQTLRDQHDVTETTVHVEPDTT